MSSYTVTQIFDSVMMVSYFIAGVAIIIVNMAAVVTFAGSPRVRRLPANYFLLSLSLIDSLTGKSMIVVVVVNSFGSLRYEHSLCLFIVQANMFCLCTSVFTVMMISMERYKRICDGLKYTGLLRKSRVQGSVVAVWIIALLLTIPVYVWNSLPDLHDLASYKNNSEFNDTLFTNTIYNATWLNKTIPPSDPNYEIDHICDFKIFNKIHLYFILGPILMLNFLLIFWNYVIIYRAALKQRKAVDSLRSSLSSGYRTPRPSQGSVTSGVSITSSTPVHAVARHGDMQRNWLTLLLIGLMYAMWIPSLAFYVAFPSDEGSIKIHWIRRVFELVAYLNAFVNPLVYHKRSKEYREAFNTLFLRRRCSRLPL